MRQWIFYYILPALVISMIGAAGVFFKHMWTRQKSFNEGILALLHDRIYSECEACETKKYATVDDLRNIEYLYKPYHALGGNGTGTTLYERVKNLPDKPEKN